jgi:hypothetical protein
MSPKKGPITIPIFDARRSAGSACAGRMGRPSRPGWVDQYKYPSDLTYATWVKILGKIEELLRVPPAE